MMRKMNLIILIIVLMTLTFTSGQAEMYSTWENMEIDKCASAWLIKRFTDKDAVFRFVPKGELITQGVPFDVPEAKIRRYHNLSAFEYIVKKYQITDPAVKKIARIIHDIEINYWGAKKIPDSIKINEQFKKIADAAKSPDECLKKGFVFFDRLYLLQKSAAK